MEQSWPMADTPRIPVRVRGTVRGVTVDADGAVRLIQDHVTIQVEDREHATRIDRVDGVVWETPVLTLHVSREAVELSGHAALQSLGAQIVSSALMLPELTRTMHGLGSRRGHPGADHDRFFAGLLAARRAAEGFVEPDSRLVAFDARRLSHTLTTLLAELAAERYPDSPPDRRALEAELLDRAENVQAALDALGEAADHVRASSSAVRLARWRDWTRAAQRVFEAADRSWIAMLPVLAASPVPVPRRRFWRRALSIGPVMLAALGTAITAVRVVART